MSLTDTDGRRWECSSSSGTSTIYYNFSNPHDRTCLCHAVFGADPDIGGIGVMLAFITTAWITCLVAAIEVYCGLCEKFRSHLANGESPAMSIDEMGYRLDQYIDDFTNYVNSRDELNWVSRYFPWGAHACRRTSRFFLAFFIRERQRTRKFAQLVLDNLCDIQVITGTAIIIAALVQIQTMAFYHQSLVLSYWLLTLNSFWASRSGNLNHSGESHGWHYWSRTFAIFVTITLSIAFQLTIIPRQYYEWDPLEPGYCFIYHDKSSYQQQYLWTAGLIYSAVYLVFMMVAGCTSESPTWMDKFSEWMLKPRRDSAKTRFLERSIVGAQSPHIISERRPRFPQPWQFMLRLLFELVFGLLRFILIFLSLWAWGNEQSILLILAYIGLAAWSTYDIIDVKISNTHLLDKSENSWGFGQVLPANIFS
ncbi:hypothetical protein B0J14DRAFT_266931 [Halenospora varia]|nr:hypothetical protein B0J14DRAFT_266931 [Halenospora varia]